MRGGKLDFPDNIIWKLVDVGLLHVHEALAVPVLSDSQPDDEPIFVEAKEVTIAEPILQIGMRRVFILALLQILTVYLVGFCFCRV